MTTTEQHKPMFTFGYRPEPNAIIAWGARAIFRPSSPTHPLDLLPDRQQVWNADEYDRSQVEQFCNFLNLSVLPEMQRLAEFFDSSSSEKFVRNFDYGYGTDLVVVAAGSPNASYGYFYVAASLVNRKDAPAEVRPDIVAEEKRRRFEQLSRENEAMQREWQAKHRAEAKVRREQAKAQREAFFSKATGREPTSGAPLELGDVIYIEANQGSRKALVVAISKTGDTALIEYAMPNGRRFKWEVDRTTHRYIRNINKVPSRFTVTQ